MENSHLTGIHIVGIRNVTRDDISEGDTISIESPYFIKLYIITFSEYSIRKRALFYFDILVHVHVIHRGS